MKFLKDSDGKKILVEEIFSSSYYKNKILSAISKFKTSNYRFYFPDNEDLLQSTYAYIWEKLPQYNNKKSALNTYLYWLIRSALLLNGYTINKEKRSNKSLIHEITRNYQEIWALIGNNRKFEETVKASEVPMFSVHFLELLENLKEYFNKKKKYTVVKVLILLIRFSGDKKMISKSLGLTIIRINQIMQEICGTKIFKEFLAYSSSKPYSAVRYGR